MDDGALSVGTFGTYPDMSLWMDLLYLTMRMVVNHGPRSATTLLHSNYIPCPTLGFYFLHTILLNILKNSETTNGPQCPFHLNNPYMWEVTKAMILW